MTELFNPCTVIAVNTGDNTAAKLIREGEELQHLPNQDNHVIGYRKTTKNVLWGLSGQPNGVGWENLAPYILNGKYVKYSYDNREQTATWSTDLLVQAVHFMDLAIGTAYDWDAIRADVKHSAHLDILNNIEGLFSPGDVANWKDDGTVPGHVVCSSLYAWIYMVLGQPHPGISRERFVFPGDWTKFIQQKAWTKA